MGLHELGEEGRKEEQLEMGGRADVQTGEHLTVGWQ